LRNNAWEIVFGNYLTRTKSPELIFGEKERERNIRERKREREKQLERKRERER
jgi:hypothetical protein